MNEQFIALGIVWFVVFIFSVTLHEAAHALAAKWMGDDTGYLGGQVTMDPTPHVLRSPIGMVVVPLVSYVLFNGKWMMGWASCPYDPNWAIQHPRRQAVMAAAGPLVNLCLATFAAIALKIGLTTGYFVQPILVDNAHLVESTNAAGSMQMVPVLSVMLVLNLVLGIFNLFPFPPLDGGGILLGILPTSMARKAQLIIWDPVYAQIGLIASWAMSPYLIGPPLRWVLGWLWQH